ncbi:MAG: hypothetical protein IT258_23095 [Saprospiraceae bacterium]|nr:hypothetical protein [Saprospiraceae bacterium]
MEQQANWLDTCKAVFETNLLNDFTKRLLLESSTKISATQQRLEGLNAEIVKIQKEREELSTTTTALEQLEPKYRQLIENKDLLVSRKLELEELEAAVEAGNLVELASSIEAKELEMQPVIAEKQRLEERRTTLLSEQTANEQKVQALIDQAQTIGRASSLFQEMESKINQHNEVILKDFQEESELLRLQLDFNQRTSGELIDAPLEKIIVDIKAGLVEIEKQLKEKISAQTAQQA